MIEAPSGHAIVARLKGRWHGKQGMCRCPAHDDASPSLSVNQPSDGVVLVHCHAGCPQLSVIAALRELGLWPDRDEAGHPSYPQKAVTPRRDSEADEDELARIAKAQAIWNDAAPIDGTHAEAYLRARAVGGPLPASLRFAPQLYHRESGRYLPALVGALQDGANRVVAVQRIYLHPSEPRKADKPNKLTLGPMRNAAVRLGWPDRILGIAEGIETGLSAQAMFSVPVWAALGASRLGSLMLPETVGHVVIFADNGAAGVRAAHEAMRAYQDRGLRADIEAPEGSFSDFNDVAQADAA